MLVDPRISNECVVVFGSLDSCYCSVQEFMTMTMQGIW